MADLGTTTMSSKGQVVIPENLRMNLGFNAGDQFVVTGNRDVLVLKRLPVPDMTEFDDIVARARKAAKTVGLKKQHVAAAIKKSRRLR